MAENNTQSRKWLLTINNPSEHGLNHAAICEILEMFKKLDYWCMCDEEGDECSTLLARSRTLHRRKPAE